MDKYAIATDMMAQSGFAYVDIDKKTLDNIDEISKGYNFSLSEWKKYLEKNQDLINFAILSHPNAHTIVKIKAVHQLEESFQCDENLFVPFLLRGEKEVISNLTHQVAKTLIDAINCSTLINLVNKHIDSNPDIKAFPFANTHIESLIISKIINSKTLNSDELNDYNTYKIIEFCQNETALKSVLGNLTEQHPYVLTAILNNPFMSEEFKMEAYNAGADIFKITTPQKEDIMKDIYQSIIDGIKYSDSTSSPTALVNQVTIEHFLTRHLLPPSCELDALKRFNDNEIHINTMKMVDFIKQTKNKDVLREALKNHKSIIVSSALTNPNIDNTELINKVKSSIHDFSVYHRISIFEKENLLNILPYINTSDKKMLREVAITLGIDAALAKKQLSENPYIPAEIIEEYIKDNYPQRNIAEFNLLIRDKLDVEDFRKFMNTINSLLQIQMSKEIGSHEYHRFYIPQNEQFLPHYSSKENKILRDALKEVINRNILPDTIIAKKYLRRLDKKDAFEKTKDNFSVIDISSLSRSDVVVFQKVLLDKIFNTKPRKIGLYQETIYNKDISHKRTTYDLYSVYKGLLDNSSKYQETLERNKELSQIQSAEAKKRNTDDITL